MPRRWPRPPAEPVVAVVASGPDGAAPRLPDQSEQRREIVEYQVRQTPQGATIAVNAARAFDPEALAAEITDHLREAGLADPEITVVRVEAIERPASGKLARFLPLR